MKLKKTFEIEKSLSHHWIRNCIELQSGTLTILAFSQNVVFLYDGEPYIKPFILEIHNRICKKYIGEKSDILQCSLDIYVLPWGLLYIEPSGYNHDFF